MKTKMMQEISSNKPLLFIEHFAQLPKEVPLLFYRNILPYISWSFIFDGFLLCLPKIANRLKFVAELLVGQDRLCFLAIPSFQKGI